MKVTFVAPNIGITGTFYEIFTDFLSTAARQLKVELDVVDATKNRDNLLSRARAIASQRPDYMLVANYMSVGQELLAANAAAGVQTFFVVEALSGGELGSLASGTNRTGYLGQIVPDDVEAGKMLAEILAEAARARGLADAAGKLHVGAIAGEHTQAGNARFRGLQSVLKQQREVVQAAFQYGAWEEAPAKDVAALMLKTAPQIRILWCANDAMALGALAAAVEAGRQPGKDILIGGIDLMDRALAEMAAGRIEVSIGGHVVDGIRALLLLYDHHEKHDLKPESRTTHLVAVRRDQADRYLRFMKDRAWRNVDFTRFSRVRNPQAPESGPSLEALMGR